MIQRWRSALVTLVAVLAVASVSVAAQSRSEASDPTVTPRSPDVHPDLRGVWDFRTVTPLERPAELAEQEFLTEEEVAAYEVQRVQERNADLNRETTVTNRRVVNGTTETADLRLAYNDFWWDRGTRVVGTHRTSLVIDPPDGRVPVLTPEGRSRAEARVARSRRPTEGPEDRSLSERCITGFNSGPPMVSGGYNQNVQIFQTADHVVLLNEMVHNARIIPLDGRPHGTVRQWTGDSRGHWEGDTLVVDTTNFLRETSFANSSSNLHLVERFTRVDADTLTYEFTVEDPTTWTRPWTVQLPMIRSDQPLFEYACQEGNYGMTGTLTGARAIEAADTVTR